MTNQTNIERLEDEIKSKIFELNNKDRQVGLFRVRTVNKSLMDAKEQPIPRNLYHNLVFEGEITFLFADTGIGKTIYALQIANQISKTDKVLYIDLELSDKQFEARYSTDYKDHYIFNPNLFRVDFQRQFHIPEGYNYDSYFIQSLKGLITETQAKVIVIDNMTKLVSSDTDKAKEAKPLMDLLCSLKFEYHLTLLLLEHTKKIDSCRPISLNDLQGSKMKTNFADAAFSIGRSAKDKNYRYIKQLKCRSCELVYDSDHVWICEVIKENSFLQFKPVGYGKESEHLTERNLDDKASLKEQVKSLSEKGYPQRKIADKIGISLGSVNNYLKG